jgi:hypothetical protein
MEMHPREGVQYDEVEQVGASPLIKLADVAVGARHEREQRLTAPFPRTASRRDELSHGVDGLLRVFEGHIARLEFDEQLAPIVAAS